MEKSKHIHGSSTLRVPRRRWPPADFKKLLARMRRSVASTKIDVDLMNPIGVNDDKILLATNLEFTRKAAMTQLNL